MMSLIDLDDDQRWVPTHVNVTVIRARGLRTKGKHGSRYLYTIVQVGKEKFTTGMVEKAAVPVWDEECCFQLPPGILEEGGRSAFPAGSGDLVLSVMHRVLIGLDVFLGQTIIPLDKIFQDGMCPRNEWFKLKSKAGRKEKERGELQVTVQFTRNNMTASMFDLTIQDKPRSAFGKLKDRVTGRKRGDMESSSAIVPGRYAALSASAGQPFGEDGVERGSGGGGMFESQDVELTEEKRSKMKDFFKGKLRKSSDTRSCSSLASDSSMSSKASDNPGPPPPPSLDLMSDPPTSPIYTTKVRADAYHRDTDLAKKVLSSQHTTKVFTHKRAQSDEASKINTAPTVESLKGQTMTQSKSSLCINGSHVYNSEPSTPRSSVASKLVLLEKCSPLSLSLQNLTKRGEDKSSLSEGRRWSFDKTKKEEKEDEKEVLHAPPPNQQGQAEGGPVQAFSSGSMEKGKKVRKTLFSGGRSDSLPGKSELNQTALGSEGRLRGWFGSADSQNKPRLEGSPKVDMSLPLTPPLPCSPLFPHESSSPPDEHHQSHTSPSSNPISPSNPFFMDMQQNPFFEELEAEALLPLAPPSCSSLGSSPFHYTILPFQSSLACDINTSIKRERPRPVARQTSLPALLTKTPLPNCSNHTAPRSMSGDQDDGFDAFASSRFSSPKGRLPHNQKHQRTSSTPSYRCSNTIDQAQEPPPLPTRRLLKTPVNEIYSDGWLHRGQELAVHKEAYLLSQTGVASLQRVRNSVSTDCQASSDIADSGSTSSRLRLASMPPGFICEEKMKKFKYEPLQDEMDCWGGMLFEQDLYGRMCRGQYGQTKVNNHYLSQEMEKADGNNVKSKDSDPQMLHDCKTSIDQSTNNPSNPDLNVVDGTHHSVQGSVDFNPTVDKCMDNNNSLSLTLGELNMNVNNSDFGFIDSHDSSVSEATHTLESIDCLSATSPQTTEDSLTGCSHMEILPDDSLNKNNSLVETLQNMDIQVTHSPPPVSPSRLCKEPPVSKGCCQDCPPCGDSNMNSSEIGASLLPNQMSNSVSPAMEPREGASNVDENGNSQVRLKQPELFSGVVSARLRPKGVSSPNVQSKIGGKMKSTVSEGLRLHQTSDDSLCAFDNKNDLEDTKRTNTALQKSLKNDTCHLSTFCITGKPNEINFPELHAKVAPNTKCPSTSKIGQSLHEPEPCTPSANPALSPSIDTQIWCSPIHHSSTKTTPGACTTLAVAPFTTTPSSTTDQPLVDAWSSLLPEETQPALNLPHLKSRPHPVKPLNSSQSEKKDGRSVLEKLKSTIHPGRSVHQVTAEAEKTQEVTANNSAQYQHLTNMELISLLLQQEMDMQKQQAASEQQGARLEKCEAELRKVKAQMRDLEDYIDNLLLRIMEQTPTLLQVRSRHK